MQLLLVHLSDIHFRVSPEENLILGRLDALCAAVRSIGIAVDACFIVISGDIAFSGDEREYEHARDFIARLQKNLAGITELQSIELVTIPGNHDCDFSLSDSVRSILLDGINEKNVDPTIIQKCTSLQDSYFTFSPVATQCTFANTERLYWNQSYVIKDCLLTFHLFNSAWISRLHERQGQSFMPIKEISEALRSSAPADISIASIHHPFNWFESNNARKLRELLESNADLILTGHEHAFGIYKKIGYGGEQSEYLEGGVLQEGSDPTISSFNIVLIDTDKEQQKPLQYEYNTNEHSYQRVGQDVWWPFERNKARLKHRFEISRTFHTYLEDHGIGFLHPRRHSVLLSDLFVYPDFAERQSPFDFSSYYLPIHGRAIIPYVIQNKKVIIIGNDHSGKTALLKTLFRDLRSNGKIPVFIHGGLVRSSKPDHLKDVISTVFNEQYSTGAELYFQLDKSNKAILIDDLDEVRLNRRDRDATLGTLTDMFDLVIMTANPALALDAIVFTGGPEINLWSSRIIDILELGFVLRSDLVNRWFMLEPPSAQEEALSHERTIRVEELVTRFLGKNLLPSYPFFIIVVLQELSAKTEHDEASGAFGYLYEVLITRSLALGPSARIDLDTKYNYLTELAYHLFDSGLQSISDDDARDWHAKYCQEYKLHLDFERITQALTKSSILEAKGDQIGFKYRYLFYFFVARHFRDSLSNISTQERLRIMTSRLYEDESSNIIMFLCHLSKDPVVVSGILQASDLFFDEYQECDLENDVLFLNKLGIVRRFSLEDDLSANRKKLLEEKDSINKGLPSGETRQVEQTPEYRSISAAIRTIQIIGQMLRNFSGSLKGDTKAQLIDWCLKISLRSMAFVMRRGEANFDKLAPILKFLLRNEIVSFDDPDEQHNTDQSIEAALNRLIFNMFEEIAFFFISEASFSLGMKSVSLVLKEVVQLEPSVSRKLILVACKLTRINEFPEQEVINLARDLRKNPFAETLLRRLVWQRFYLYPDPFRVRQKVCAQLGIHFSDPRLIEKRNKLVEPTH